MLYPLGVRDPLAAFPVPLRGTEEATADLAGSFDRAFDSGGFDLVIDYSGSPQPPLAPEHEAWADALLREKGLR